MSLQFCFIKASFGWLNIVQQVDQSWRLTPSVAMHPVATPALLSTAFQACDSLNFKGGGML